MLIMAPVSAGELLDKITILRVKALRLGNPDKLRNVQYELRELEAISEQHIVTSKQIADLMEELYYVNPELWDIEDGKRDAERRQAFDDRFIKLARDVYLKNDLRARIKKEINLLTGSAIVEEKSHHEF